MTVAWLTPEETERARDVRCRALESLRTHDPQVMREEPDVNWLGVYRIRMTHFNRIAVTTFLLDEDPAETRRCFQLCGEAAVHTLELSRDAPEGKRFYYAEDAAVVMEAALASGDMRLAARIAGLCGCFDLTPGHPTVRNYARVVQYTIVADESSARDSVEKLASSTRKPPYQQLGRVYMGLLNRSRDTVEKELKAYIKWYAKKHKPVTEKYWTPETGNAETCLIPFDLLLSTSGLAFCNLAASRGMKLEVDEPFLPRALLAY